MIYFRGFRILKATLKALFEKGLNDASEVVLTGCSGTDNESHQLIACMPMHSG